MKTRKRGIAALLGAAMISVLAFSGCGQTTGTTDTSTKETTTQSEVVSENNNEQTARQLMEDLNGTYVELFSVLFDEQYDDLWLDTTISCVGEENAQMYVDMLKGSVSGTVIGQEAVDTYAEDPESAKFDCSFTEGVETFQFKDSVITGFDTDGNEVFSHTYAFVDYNEESDFYEYATEDADAGEFTYFAIRPDTPATTYHIEFRYGSDFDSLAKFYEGSYAYWMASGILADDNGAMAEKSIELFCTENLPEQ